MLCVCVCVCVLDGVCLLPAPCLCSSTGLLCVSGHTEAVCVRVCVFVRACEKSGTGNGSQALTWTFVLCNKAQLVELF